jgi:hypothetical protein
VQLTSVHAYGPRRPRPKQGLTASSAISWSAPVGAGSLPDAAAAPGHPRRLHSARPLL